MRPTNHSKLDGRLTARDDAILSDLERYRLLTTRQLQRLHFPAQPLGTHSSVSAATRGTTRVLGRLEGLGAIARLVRRIGGIKHGSAASIWQLASAGDRYVRARRGDPIRRRYDEPGLVFIEHQVAVADVATTLTEYANARRFDLLELELEPTCWRTFTGPSGAAITLKPDLLAVTADATTETHAFVEVDRGTEHLPAVLRKCRTYQRYFATGAEQATRGLFPAVVWIVPNAVRAAKIRDAIHDDAALLPDVFWTATPEQLLHHLAPYGASTTDPKGGIS